MVSDSYLPTTTRVFLEKLAAESNRKAGILSLSERNDDILMWSHYADCHRGICLEFCAHGKSNLFEDAKPVVYSEAYPRLDLLTDERLRAAVPWMLTKSKRWEYEKECGSDVQREESAQCGVPEEQRTPDPWAVARRWEQPY